MVRLERVAAVQTSELAAALVDLHARRLSEYGGDVLERLANLLYEPLLKELAARRRFRDLDDQIIASAVADALVEYAGRPASYSPASGKALDRHLALAAHRNVLNQLRSESRRRKHESAAARQRKEIGPGDVELRSPAGTLLSKEAADALNLKHARLMTLMATDVDRRILELKLQDERRTSAYAEVMGISHLPADQQRKEVKRAKDRIDKVIARAGLDQNEDSHD